MEYIRSPAEIYEESFATIQREVSFEAFPPQMHPVVTRMVHACGVTDISRDIRYSENSVSCGMKALKGGSAILCDVEMVRAGIIEKYLCDDNKLLCTLNDERTPDFARQIGNTRSAAAVEFWEPHIRGSVVVIGNAPTALFRLLEKLDQGMPKPALIIGLPVGFVGAAESKQELCENPRGCEFITLAGRMGGSAIASACFNAIAGGLSHA